MANLLPCIDRSAVINEALRIHPSTGLILERCVPPGGVTIHGSHIAERTIIGVNCWVVNRNKDIFGDDSDFFRPERWIDCTPEVLSIMRRNLFTVSIMVDIQIPHHRTLYSRRFSRS